MATGTSDNINIHYFTSITYMLRLNAVIVKPVNMHIKTCFTHHYGL
jgi:hypothetical protein